MEGSSEPALNVTQFHFTAWPDHGVPDYATSLLGFHKKLKKYHKPAKGPMVIHCRYTDIYDFTSTCSFINCPSAGVGRTGTLITIDCVLDRIEKEGVVDIAGTIIHLRTQRMKMVQSLVCFLINEVGYGTCMHSSSNRNSTFLSMMLSWRLLPVDTLKSLLWISALISSD